MNGQTRRALVLALLVALGFTSIAGASRTRTHSSARVVSPATARRIAAVWGSSLTFLPTWAPSGVVPSRWWSETCACGTDDSRLVVQFKRQATRLDWVVTDQHEYDRVRSGVACSGAGSPARVLNGRTVFYRPAAGIAWSCIPIPAGARWYPSVGKPAIAPLGKLIVSVHQLAGRNGRLKPAELERMVASTARSSRPGRTSLSRYELPPRRDVSAMAAGFGRQLLLPTVLPGGFIYSDWKVSAHAEPGVDPRRQINVSFSRDSLFQQILWSVSYGVDRLGLDCQRKNKLRPRAVISGRPIYANEGIHGVSVWTCLPRGVVGNVEPLEVSMWYDIRLHNPKMLRLATRMIGTATLERVR